MFWFFFINLRHLTHSKEHKGDIRIGNLNNALFQHVSQSNHNSDFDSAKMVIYNHSTKLRRILVGVLNGIMVKGMDGGIVENEFVLQLRYFVHFRANTLGKGMNPLILPAMG